MKILLIDDDETFCATLGRSLTRRGFAVKTAQEPDRALAIAQEWQPTHAVLDLKLGNGVSGLELISPLVRLHPHPSIVVLTGYASIATTVTAMKRGAIGYLAKPVDAHTVAAALGGAAEDSDKSRYGQRMSLKRLEWEHINRVLAEHDGNVSATARTLGLYRRTLQRKLDKRPVRD